MEPEKVIQNMDSLWFFSNPLLSKNHLSSPLSPNIKHNNTPTTKKLNSIHSSLTLRPLTPKTATTTCRIHQPSSPSLTEISPMKAIINVETNDVDSRLYRARVEPREGEGSSKRKPRTKKSSLHRQHFIKCTNAVENGYGSMVEMPLCNDDEAMKKYLKTWAAAVAYKAVLNTNSLMVVACS